MTSDREGLQSFEVLKHTGMQPIKKKDLWNSIDISMQNTGRRPALLQKLRRTGGPFFVGIAGLVIVAIGLPVLWHWHQRPLQSSSLAGQRQSVVSSDNFSPQTMAKLQGFIQAVSKTKLNFQPYVPTGGLNEQNPSIEAWSDNLVEVDITFSTPTGQCKIREYSKDSSVIKQESWEVAGHVGDQTYYKAPRYSNGLNVYLFYKGTTAVWVETINTPFPTGLMSHLTRIHSGTGFSSTPSVPNVGQIVTKQGVYIRTSQPLSSFHLPSSAISFYRGSLAKQNEELNSKPGIVAIVRPYGLYIRSDVLKETK